MRRLILVSAFAICVFGCGHEASTSPSAVQLPPQVPIAVAIAVTNTQWNTATPADFFVTAGAPLTKPGEAMPMDERLGRALQDIPGIDVALPIRFQALPFRGGVFDAVMCVAAVPYFADPQAALAEWRRVCRPQGQVVFTVPPPDGIQAVEIVQ